MRWRLQWGVPQANLIGEYTTGGGLIKDYVYLGSKPIALISLPEGIRIGPIRCPSICNINVTPHPTLPLKGVGRREGVSSFMVFNGLLYILPLFLLALIRIYRRGKRGRIDLAGLILIAGVVSLVIVMLTRAQTEAQTSQENIYYYRTDHLGTPIKLTDANQQTVWDATYEPFGKATVTTSTVTNNLRFPGQYYDAETGLHYNWHRYYWPEVGRYVTPEKITLGTAYMI